MKMKIEPSLSWSDIVMTFGLIASGFLAFTAISEGVAKNAIAIEFVEQDIQQLTADHAARLQQEREDRERMRTEMREDLLLINQKLDRLIERELSDG